MRYHSERVASLINEELSKIIVWETETCFAEYSELLMLKPL